MKMRGLIIVVFFFCQLVALGAGEVKAARQKFAVGDVPAAAALLEPIVIPRPRVRGKELEEARKLLGICKYILGDKTSASKVFQDVLIANPNAKLNPKDALDPTVIDFFEQVRSQAPARSAAPSRNSAAQTLNGKNVSKPGKTGIFVKTNAPRATVFANGIFVGTPGQDIALNPGRYQITISAEGHQEQNFQVQVQQGVTKNLSVTLRPPPRAVAPAAAVAQNRSARSQGSGKRGEDFSRAPRQQMNYKNDLPAPRAAQGGGRNLMDEFYSDVKRPEPTPAPVQQPPPAQVVYAPTPLPQQVQPVVPSAPPPAPVPTPAPVYLAPPVPVPQVQVAPYGGVQAVQPRFQQPQAPVYQLQQPVAAPVQAPQQVYAPAPVAPGYAPGSVPQAVQNYGQNNQMQQQPVHQNYSQANQQPVPQQPVPQQAPVSRGASGRRRERKESLGIMAIMPFGMPQFQLGDSNKGMIVAGVQLGGLGWWFYNYQSEATWKKKITDQPDDSPEFKTQSDAYLNKLKTQQMVGLGIFAAGWIYSIYDAMNSSDTRRTGFYFIPEQPGIFAEVGFRY